MPNSDQRVIAVVDPVAAGSPYGAEIRAMGMTPIGILTKDFQDPYTSQSLHREDFAEIYRHRTAAQTADFLRNRNVAAVVPGDQMALAWSDLFADAIGVAGNPVDSMIARFNKRTMKERWAAHGVPCADWYESSDLASTLSWVRQRGFPVVLKPNASTGSCHVFMCCDEDEVVAAFTTITTQPDADGTFFEAALVEEYLDGDEYFMNLLHDGTNSSVISLARYDKVQKDGRPGIYRSIRSMALDDPLAQEILPLAQAANRALGVHIGINDLEFKMTSHGFRAIEINNRLPGAGTPLMIHQCSGLNCYQESVRLYLGEYVKPATQYHFGRHYCVCCLINDQPGLVVGYSGLDEVAELSSFENIRLIAQPGTEWPVTHDLASAWGLVWLMNEDERQLDRDAAEVHDSLRLRVR